MATAAENTSIRGSLRRKGLKSDFFLLLTWVAAVATVASLVWIVWSILEAAFPAIQKEGLSFFTSAVWDNNRERFGALPFIVGTAASSLIALLFALPLGVMFLGERIATSTVLGVLLALAGIVVLQL